MLLLALNCLLTKKLMQFEHLMVPIFYSSRLCKLTHFRSFKKYNRHNFLLFEESLSGAIDKKNRDRPLWIKWVGKQRYLFSLKIRDQNCWNHNKLKNKVIQKIIKFDLNALKIWLIAIKWAIQMEKNSYIHFLILIFVKFMTQKIWSNAPLPFLLYVQS